MQKHIIVSRLKLAVLLMAIVGLLGVMSAIAQSGGGYDLARSVTASSGLIGGGGYSLNAVVGQAEAQGWSGGGYTLFGGFWGGGRIIRMHRIYFPLTPYIIIEYPGANSGE